MATSLPQGENQPDGRTQSCRKAATTSEIFWKNWKIAKDGFARHHQQRPLDCLEEGGEGGATASF